MQQGRVSASVLGAGSAALNGVKTGGPATNRTVAQTEFIEHVRRFLRKRNHESRMNLMRDLHTMVAEEAQRVGHNLC